MTVVCRLHMHATTHKAETASAEDDPMAECPHKWSVAPLFVDSPAQVQRQLKTLFLSCWTSLAGCGFSRDRDEVAQVRCKWMLSKSWALLICSAHLSRIVLSWNTSHVAGGFHHFMIARSMGALATFNLPSLYFQFIFFFECDWELLACYFASFNQICTLSLRLPGEFGWMQETLVQHVVFMKMGILTFKSLIKIQTKELLEEKIQTKK